MSNFSKEELLEHARENVKALRFAARQSAFKSARPAIERDLKLAEIALASLETNFDSTGLPGGFSIEEAKSLHTDLVRSHISKALSGEKMKSAEKEENLRWIHAVIVRAAWFVQASVEAFGTGSFLAEQRARGVETAIVELNQLADRSEKEAPIAAGHHRSAALYLQLVAAELRSEVKV